MQMSHTRKNLNRIDLQRLSFDTIRLDHSQRVLVNREYEVRVAGDRHQPEPVTDVVRHENRPYYTRGETTRTVCPVRRLQQQDQQEAHRNSGPCR